MSKTGTYLGGSTILGWSGAPRSAARKRSGGKGLLAREVEAHEPTLQRSEHMPPLGPAPVQARKPSAPKPARKKKPISAAELVHFSFGGRSKDRVLDDLEPIVWKLAQNGFRKPADVARLLNKQGVKTACGEQWSTQLAWHLLDLLFERRRQQRAARLSKAPAAPRVHSTSKAPLSSEEIARRLSALGRVARSH